MPEVSITTKLSDDDRESIIEGVLAAIKPLLDTRSARNTERTREFIEAFLIAPGNLRNQ